MKIKFSFGLVLINHYSKLQLLVFICQNGHPPNINRDLVKPLWAKYSFDENQNLTHIQVYVSFQEGLECLNIQTSNCHISFGYILILTPHLVPINLTLV